MPNSIRKLIKKNNTTLLLGPTVIKLALLAAPAADVASTVITTDMPYTLGPKLLTSILLLISIPPLASVPILLSVPLLHWAGPHPPSGEWGSMCRFWGLDGCENCFPFLARRGRLPCKMPKTYLPEWDLLLLLLGVLGHGYPCLMVVLGQRRTFGILIGVRIIFRFGPGDTDSISNGQKLTCWWPLLMLWAADGV